MTLRDTNPLKEWWARLGLNQRPLRCQRSALPLSYAPILIRQKSSINSIQTYPVKIYILIYFLFKTDLQNNL